jgi:predicted RNA binding protein YcfA (HicA-like mRNA interferase family)
MTAARLPALKAREVIRALQKAGFSVVRTSGSHHRLVHDTDPTRQTTVPVHQGKLSAARDVARHHQAGRLFRRRIYRSSLTSHFQVCTAGSWKWRDKFLYIQTDNQPIFSVLYTQNPTPPGEIPGVTRYPHPKSNNTLKSKAPASGVPARPRVFFLTPHDPTTKSMTKVKCTPPARHAQHPKDGRACLAFLRGV